MNLPPRGRVQDVLGRTPIRDTEGLVDGLVNVIYDEYEAGNLSDESAITVGHHLAHSMFWADPVFRKRHRAARQQMKGKA